ncbi:alkaline phosphatase family protein [Amycolatopsis benzoatilytica]|uniref:alkaline phosphatase family protein n=1 Tax=Amycolatopsis benzoatilytica TaxID=346045 RepID=UPI00037F29A3|nr:alkaline phosphatase family protein [Amycolatopsis benzoatilytica]
MAHGKRWATTVVAAATAALGLAASPASASQDLSTRAAPPKPDHVVIVMMENRGYRNIIGSSHAPYLNSLTKQGALFTNSFALTHPSEPNYIALLSGSTQGVTDDSCPHTFKADNLAHQLTAAGGSFTGYSESLPKAGYTGCEKGDYARKHSPWVNFSDIPASANQPYTSFPADYTKLPTLSWVTPNLQDDMHDGTIQQGDAWLKKNLDGYAQWAKTHNSLLIVTWDEDEDDGGNNSIPTIFVGANVKTGQYSEKINHYTVLSTLESAYGLPALGSAAKAKPITDVWGS